MAMTIKQLRVASDDDLIEAHDEVASYHRLGWLAVGALLMGPEGTFITGSEFLMDGGVTASYFYGELAPR